MGYLVSMRPLPLTVFVFPYMPSLYTLVIASSSGALLRETSGSDFLKRLSVVLQNIVLLGYSSCYLEVLSVDS